MWSELGEVDGPEIGGGRSSAGEDGGSVEGDVDSVGVKSGGATVVAELADGEEGAGGEGGEDVGDASRGW